MHRHREDHFEPEDSHRCILFFTAIPVLFAVETEEQRFRQEVETRQGEMEVSFEEYEEILSKLLAPRRQMDINLRHVLITLSCILLVVVSVFFYPTDSREFGCRGAA